MQVMRKMMAPGLIAMLFATGMGVAACGGGDDDLKAGLIAKVKEDPEMKDLPDTAIDCVADVYIKYGDKEQLKAVVDGKRSPDEEVKGLDLDNENVKKEMTACAQKK